MKIAVLGPVCRDEVVINSKKHVSMGGIPYYVGKALQALGVSCTLFITHAEEDKEWVREQLEGLELIHIFSEKTLCMQIQYSSPDERLVHTEYDPNRIAPEDVVHLLEEFDYIIMGPLFYGNIDDEIFNLLSHKKIVLGNFGMFNYAEGNKLVKKNPEKAIAVLPHVDFLFLDEGEVKFVAQKNSVTEAVEILKNQVDNIIITKGSQGSEVFIDEKHYDIPAFQPKLVADPTGAGDTYLAAFITGLEFLKDIQKIGEFAAMSATMSIEEKGPLKASKEEIFQRLGWSK
ncbi:hypothetical protein KY339_04070 [Candidatus Woesearchaeota archaeon]|nr:hypothetical protein [Candidatus Woesearchaeota archaeon]